MCWYSWILCYGVTDLLQMISCDDAGVGSSRSWLWERLRERRCIRPQGTTDGNEHRQLWDRSRTVIRDDTSMNQSRSNQGSFSPDQSTWTACGRGKWNTVGFSWHRVKEVNSCEIKLVSIIICYYCECWQYTIFIITKLCSLAIINKLLYNIIIKYNIIKYLKNI